MASGSNTGEQSQSISQRELDRRFTYHAPKDGQPEKYVALRDKAKEFAELVSKLCPPCRESSLAVTRIEEAVMWANSSIARCE